MDHLWALMSLAHITGWLAQSAYLALGVLVLAGNLGMPVPENCLFWAAGYVAWKGKLWVPGVLVVGISAAILGDNLGYWLGRQYGAPLLDRYGPQVGLSPTRRLRLERWVLRCGGWTVFLGRFVLGLRTLAGPVAGVMGVPRTVFFLANAAGALLYVPFEVGVGYATGYGVGHLSARHTHQAQAALLIALGAFALGAASYQWWVRRRVHA